MSRAPNFDRIARAYRWLEFITFGNSLWQCRCAFLLELRSCRNALVIGDGDGRFTASLLELNPAIRIDAVDISGAMLHTLVRNAKTNASRVRIHQADALDWIPANPPYDLIVSHFLLDCLTTAEVACLARRLHSCISPSSRWIVSEFSIPQGWFGRVVARPLITILYFAFALLTGTRVFKLPRHREALVNSGYKLHAKKYSLAKLLASEIWVPVSRDEITPANAMLESTPMELTHSHQSNQTHFA